MSKIARNALILLGFIMVVFYPNNQGLKAGSQKVYQPTIGEIICQEPGYHCLTIESKLEKIEKKTKHGVKIIEVETAPTWTDLWPNDTEREIIMKVNRLNIKLKQGMVIAVPNDLANKTFMDFSPYPKETDSLNEKFLIFDPKLLAWAAYDAEGKLVRWGPASGGKPGYHTPAREFRIFKKAGPKCRSSKYDAPMPWAMFFHKAGYAFHGSPNVPGKNASHGCVRLFNEDAEWLNKNFIEVGTKVIIRPYTE